MSKFGDYKRIDYNNYIGSDIIMKYNWQYSGVHCGIYKITNKVTEQCYVGLSTDILNR